MTHSQHSLYKQYTLKLGNAQSKAASHWDLCLQTEPQLRKSELKHYQRCIQDNGWAWDHIIKSTNKYKAPGPQNPDNHCNSILARKPLLCSCWGKSQFLDLHQPRVCRWTQINQGSGKCEARDESKCYKFAAEVYILFAWQVGQMLDRWAKYSRAGSATKGVKSCHMRPRRLSPRPRTTLAP